MPFTTNRPAVAGEAPWIPSGTYVLTTSSSRKYRISVITQARTRDLVGKRVVSRWNVETLRWEAFAFVSVDGRLKVWSRFVDREDAEYDINFARHLLTLFNNAHHEAALDSNSEDMELSRLRADVGSYRIPLVAGMSNFEVQRFTCEYCNNELNDLRTVEMATGRCTACERLRNPSAPAATTPFAGRDLLGAVEPGVSPVQVLDLPRSEITPSEIL